MGGLADNAVWIALVFFGVVVLAALGWLVLRGLVLWRAIKAAKRAADDGLAALTAETDRMSAALDAMPQRQSELQGALATLQGRVRVAQLLAQNAGEAATALRAPLRYLGG